MENGQPHSSTTEEPRVNGAENGKLNGPISGLSDHEQEQFKSFIEQCRDEGLLEHPVGLSAEDAPDGLNDEVTLLRFLAARSFDIPGALQQFKEAHKIRNSVNSTEAYSNFDIDDFEQLRCMYPHWSGHRTKLGLPICTLDIVYLDGSHIAKFNNYAPAEITCRAITSIDYLTRFVLPLCSAMIDRPNPEKAISNAVYLIDIADLTLRQTWGIRRYAQSITGLLATCYPEVVDKIYILNAPSYFSKIWAFIKSWIDPNTAKKLVVVNPEDALTTLLETIDMEYIPERYGGKSTVKEGMIPTVDGLKELLGVETLPDGPIKWITDQGIRTAAAVGTRNGEARVELLNLSGVKATL